MSGGLDSGGQERKSRCSSVPQGLHGIDATRARPWQPTYHRADREQHQRNTDERDRVARCESEEQALDEGGRQERDRRTQHNPRTHELECFANNHPPHLDSLRAERNPDADLARALRDRHPIRPRELAGNGTDRLVFSRISRTALSLNSSENCRRAPRLWASFGMRDIVSTFRKMSTKPDQAQGYTVMRTRGQLRKDFEFAIGSR